MRANFNFMTQPGNYRTVVDPIFGLRGAASAISRAGIVRSVAFLEAPAYDTTMFRGKQRRGRISGRDRAIDLFTQPSPELDFLFWDIPSGRIWTWANPNIEGEAVAAELAASVRVAATGGAIPSLSVEGSLTLGDIRRDTERDTVTYYSRDETKVNGSVTFIYAGDFAADAELYAGDRAVVVRKTALGIDVACDGPRTDVTALRDRAAAVADTVEVVA